MRCYRKMSKNRVYWLDICRSLAIICVVLCHSLEAVYSLDLEHMQFINMQLKLFIYIMFTIGRLGVPLFLFISGYLLLMDGEMYDSIKCVVFWKKKLLRLLMTTEIWIIIYNVFLWWYTNNISISTLIFNMTFLKFVDLSHMWYMPMILGIYLFIPFLAKLLEAFSKKIWIFIACIIFIYSYGGVFLDIIVRARGGDSLNYLSPIFIGDYFGLYLILGYLVKKDIFKNIKFRNLVCIGVLSFGSTVAVQVFACVNNLEYKLWYNFPFLLICSLTIFIALSRYENTTKIKKHIIWDDISQCAFGIYLVHNVILSIIRKYINMEIFAYDRLVILWILVFAISYIIVKMGSKNQYLGRFLFMIK